ncbi:MAG: non-canonical purine NTP pyrophosphatase [Gaiella sp.]|nr:non-canonical purine NTP pyrophosphatase [Gaiella sp.]
MAGDRRDPEQGASAPPRTGHGQATDCCKLVLASGNAHKLEELRRALPGLEIELLGRDDAPVEDGATFEENARIKARWGRLHAPADAWVVGEDSGIEAAALGGRPGVRTARWAAGDPVGRMVAALAGREDRRARYVCVLVAIGPEGEEVVAEGALEGMIAREASGSEGFGFDPVFLPDGETDTVAVLGNGWKETRSHRAKAAAELRRRLRP